MSNNSNVSHALKVESTFINVTWREIVLAVLLYSVTVVTICGNILVLIAVKVNKRLQTNFNYYIVNLAVTDVAVAVTAMSFKATDTMLGYWPFGEALCAMWIFFDYVTICGNILVLIAVKVNKRLQTNFNYYIVNLAVTDVAVAVTAMRFKATDTMLGYWPFGEALCAMWIFFDYVTICGNILVLVAVKVNRRLQTNFNYYIVNLAVTDVAVAVTAMSFKATDTMLGYWPFGEGLCAMWIFFDRGMTFASVFTLILISVDRFWSVTWSLHYRRHHTRRHCLVAIGLVWVFMVLLWFPPWLLDRLRYGAAPGTCYWNPSLNKEFVFILAALGHHGPFLVLVFCYTYVFVFLRKYATVSIAARDTPTTHRRGHNEARPRTTTMTIDDTVTVTDYQNTTEETLCKDSTQTGTAIVKNSESGPYIIQVRPTSNTLTVPGQGPSQCRHHKYTDGNSGERRLRRERKIFVTLSYITIAYVILWLPFHVVYDISIIDPDMVPGPILEIAFWLTYLNSTVNPLLYNFSNSEFRRTFKHILCKHWA